MKAPETEKREGAGLSRVLAGIEAAAREAGEIMLSADDVRRHVFAKEGHANFVTDYDRRVQELLFRRLRELLPEARFIGEENGADVCRPEDREGYVFCVDPIDGTSNFLADYWPSVTSIALLRDGAPALGVVYEPVRDAMFTALKGGGAFLNGERILSSGEPLSRSLVLFGTSPYDPDLAASTFRMCAAYLPRCIDLRRSGSAAWDLCSVARGSCGLFFEQNLHLWDFAAAGLIAEEAGCALTDLRGAPLRFDGNSSVACASRGVRNENYLPEL